MTISVSVSAFKAHCLAVIRQVEQDGAAVDIVRHGKVVARLVPSAAASKGTPTWHRLRGSGQLVGEPGESVLDEQSFEAAREPTR